MPDPEYQWTPDLLYKHLVALLKEFDVRYENRFRASQEAIHKAEEATKVHFQTVNEWRTLVQSMIDGLMKREEALNRLQQIADRSDQNAERAAERFRSMEKSFAEQVTVINNRLGAIENTRTGVTQGLGYIVTIIFVTAAVVGLVVALL